MNKKVPVVSVARAPKADQLANLPLEANIALAEVAGALQEGLHAFASATGLVVMRQMVETEFAERIGSLPEHARPRPGEQRSPSYVVRSGSAGTTHRFANACRQAGVGFSFGFPVTPYMCEAIVSLHPLAWRPAVEEDASRRPGVFVVEVTKLIDLRAWPESSRVIVRKERPHPGAKLSLFDTIQGFRHTAFICAPREARQKERRVLEPRRCLHAGVEDRIRQAKAAWLKEVRLIQ